jgi:hypothetical protein
MILRGVTVELLGWFQTAENVAVVVFSSVTELLPRSEHVSQ